MSLTRTVRSAVIAASFLPWTAQAQRASGGDWRLYYDADRQRVQLTFEEFDDSLSKADASRMIDELQEKTGRGR